jgi:EamA-like transporter family
MSLGALIVFMTLVRRMDASRVGALLLLVPAVTAIASWPVLGEALHPLTLVGMVVAAAGVGTVLRRQPGATRDRQPAATRERKPAATGARSGIAKICPGQPSRSNVPAGSKP